MNDILENYYNNFFKNQKINSSKTKKSFDCKNCLTQSSLEKNDILLTDGDIYLFNKNKNFLRSILFPIFPKSNIRQNILKCKPNSSILDKFRNKNRFSMKPLKKRKDSLNFSNQNESHQNKTSSTFYSVSSKKNKTASTFYNIHNKNNKKYQEFLNEKSDLIVENLLKKRKKDIIIKLNKNIPNIMEKEEFTEEKAMKMKKVQHKFLFEPSNTNNFCSSDLQIKNLCNKKYRDELLEGVSEYYLTKNIKQIKLEHSHPKIKFAILEQLSRSSREDNWKCQYGGKKNYKNFNKKKCVTQKNLKLIKNIEQSLDQKTNDLLIKTEQLKMFIKKRVKDHRHMKEEINNV